MRTLQAYLQLIKQIVGVDIRSVIERERDRIGIDAIVDPRATVRDSTNLGARDCRCVGAGWFFIL